MKIQLGILKNQNGRRCHRRLEMRTGMRLTTIKRVQAAQEMFSGFDRKYSNCDIQNSDHIPRPEVKDLPRGFARYEIIGNCYVHGYMSGEIAASGDYGRDKEYVFSVAEGRIARVQIE